MVSTAKVPLNEDDRVKMELHWMHLLSRHKFALRQTEDLHRDDAWEAYFNDLEKWREKYMDEPDELDRRPSVRRARRRAL
jgi:hypothetical protein